MCVVCVVCVCVLCSIMVWQGKSLSLIEFLLSCAAVKREIMYFLLLSGMAIVLASAILLTANLPPNTL